MHDFTPYSALAGGALIGLGATLLLAALGRVAGVSGMIGGLLVPARGDVAWRGWFVAGLFATGMAALALAPDSVAVSTRSLGVLAAAGLLVGVGTRVGSGCTSGHGVCGISRLSPRSLIATVAFIASGVLTVAVQRLLGVGP